MSAENDTSQEQQTTQGTSQDAGSLTTQTDGATLPDDGQGQQEQGEGQEAASADADKAAQEARDRDEKGRFKGVQPRIDELTRARREAEREAAYWKSIANGQQGSAQQAANEKPTPDKFDDYNAYVEALTDWKAEQAVTKQMQQRAAAQQQEVRQTTWAERQAQARASMPDYDEVVGSSDTPLAQHVADVMLESDHGPALAYHFARNPEVLSRLNGMSPLQAAREVGRIEASLAKGTPAAPAAAPAVRTTSAPKPASPIAGQGRATTPDPTRMSMDEYRKYRAGQGARWAR